MRRVLSGVLLLSPLVCVGGPLLTITCEPVKGVGQDYGPTAWERAVAKAARLESRIFKLAGVQRRRRGGTPALHVLGSRQVARVSVI